MKIVNNGSYDTYFAENPKKRVYAVDAWYTLAKCFKVEARSRAEAEKIVEDKIKKILCGALPSDGGRIAAEMGFEDCETFEVAVSGKADKKTGEIEYF